MGGSYLHCVRYPEKIKSKRTESAGCSQSSVEVLYSPRLKSCHDWRIETSLANSPPSLCVNPVSIINTNEKQNVSPDPYMFCESKVCHPIAYDNVFYLIPLWGCYSHPPLTHGHRLYEESISTMMFNRVQQQQRRQGRGIWTKKSDRGESWLPSTMIEWLYFPFVLSFCSCHYCWCL